MPPNLSLNPYSIDAKIAGIGTPVRLATHREKANFDTEMAETESAELHVRYRLIASIRDRDAPVIASFSLIERPLLLLDVRLNPA